MEKKIINNAFYCELGDEWYTRNDHPIALLRAENRARAQWIEQRIRGKESVLDIGCGGGFLTNALAEKGYQVTGIDLSETSLEVAKRHDKTGSVHYVKANAYQLPFASNSFDVVTATDILEHVEEPRRLISEAARLLRPGGLFIFHTFNRNLFSYLLVIKGVDWFVKNAPKEMHLYSLFLKPSELEVMLSEVGLKATEWTGLVPDPLSLAFWKLVVTGCVPETYRFCFTRSLSTGFLGTATSL